MTRVVVAMSGGVDSSVAAALLVDAGYDVLGMMMRLWSDDAAGGAQHNRCCQPAQMQDARRIADQLGIPFYVLDSQAVFRRTVVQAFIDVHRAGATPNPCLTCNRQIRFDWLLRNALALDADYLATGHYARISHDDSGAYLLRRGLDRHKDQSYVLSVMNQWQLERVLFPIGELPKSHVRELAAKYGLDLAGKKDSQDLCFLGGQDYRAFLRRHAADVLQPGPIVSVQGETLGKHTGLANYTIGQRKGLGISANTALYVVDMVHDSNTLVLGRRDELGSRRMRVCDAHWVSGKPPLPAFRAEVQIRYRARSQPAAVELRPGGELCVRFDEAQQGITPGQAAVLYQGDVCLGGGIIAKS